MSIVKTYSVFCDINSDECHGWIAETTEGSAVARREAKRAGWIRRDGQDQCPACKEVAARPANGTTSE